MLASSQTASYLAAARSRDFHDAERDEAKRTLPGRSSECAASIAGIACAGHVLETIIVHLHVLSASGGGDGFCLREKKYVRFQTVEKVSSEDSGRVLALLEEHLRQVAGRLEREGSRIVLSGLGPSPRAINLNDTTVLEVKPEEGMTRIEVESNFQASALLGPVGQEEIVREKLQRVIEAARQQLEEERGRAEVERRQQFEESRKAIEAQREQVVEPKADPMRPLPVKPQAGAPAVEIKDKALPEVKTADEVTMPAEGPASETAVESRTVSRTASRVGSKKVNVDKEEAKVKPFLVAKGEESGEFKQSRESKTHAAVGDSSAFEFMKQESDDAEESAQRDRTWIRWMAVAACLLVLTPFAWRYLSERRQQPPPIKPVPAAVKVPVPQNTPENAVRQWELAMRTTDAAAQTAYYAIPVEQYLWKHNVSRQDLEAMKQAEIARRRGQWTVKIEDVTIERDGDEAKVKLVKHTTEQPQGGRVRERFVPSELTLKKSLGIWWITSERDVAPRQTAVEEGVTPSWARPLAVTAPSSTASASATPSSASTN